MSEESTVTASRRSVLATVGGGGLIGWLLYGDESPAGDPVAGFCPSEEEMEDLAWIRGRFSESRKAVAPGTEFTSTLELRNSGGQDGRYKDYVHLYDDAGSGVEPAASVDVQVPSNGSTTVEVTVTAPRSSGTLEAPSLGSSCDVIAPAVQHLEVLPDGL